MKTTVILVRHAECVGNILKDKFVQGKGPKPDYLPEYRNSRVSKRGRIQGYLAGQSLKEQALAPINRYLVSLLDRPTETALSMTQLTGLSSGQPILDGLCCLNELGKSPVVKVAQKLKDKLVSGEEISLEDKSEATMMLFSFIFFFAFLHKRYGQLESKHHAYDAGSQYAADAYLAYSIRYQKFGDLIKSLFKLFNEGDEPLTKEDEDYIVHIWYWLERERAKPRSTPPDSTRMVITCDDGEELVLALDTEPKYGLALDYQKAPSRSPKSMLELAFKEREDGRPVVVITHAKRLIRLRQEIEGFDEAEYQRLAKLNSQDFPQNVSMTQYEYEDGRWTRISEPYRLPKGLAIREGTRRLGFELERSDFESICAKLDLDPKEVEDPLLDRLS